MEIERDLLKQANNVVTLGGCLAWLQRCDEIERLEERSAKRPQLSLEIDNLWWPGSPDSRVQRLVLYILGVIIRVQTTMARRDSRD